MTPEVYGPDFAQVYDLYFSSFATDVAPRIADFYLSRPQPERARQVLDLCCGTGQSARLFLDQGFEVTGLDLSEAMLEHARANAGPYVDAGAARFVRADAADFALDERFGLVVSTFDALNHLPDEVALAACFRCVARATAPGGYLIFDLSTRLGAEQWNRTTVLDRDDTYLIRRGSYDGGLRAEAIITGFVRDRDGRYRRFEQRVHNQVFDMARVAKLLRSGGWTSVTFADVRDLGRVVRHPERATRVFVIARRGETDSARKRT